MPKPAMKIMMMMISDGHCSSNRGGKDFGTGNQPQK
jgi:hypothetical protein